MSANTVIDKKINNYLIKLNYKEKKAVLNVVKTFAEKHVEDEVWEDEDYINEMNRRFKDYETGKVIGVTLRELEDHAKQDFQNKNNKR